MKIWTLFIIMFLSIRRSGGEGEGEGKGGEGGVIKKKRKKMRVKWGKRRKMM